MKANTQNDNWDAVAEEKRWQKALEGARRFQDRFDPKENLNFYILCLSELDAVTHLLQAKCFASRATFVAELKHLIDKPTMPSRSIPDSWHQAYRNYQKLWIKSII